MDFTRRILIVDDDAGIRELIGEFLTAHGYDVTVAADPTAMRAALAAETFDLIVLDVIMPKEDGLTALRQLGPDAPPVIMLSAVGSDVDRIVGLELGADDYLAKPCNPRELLARVRTVLRRNCPVEGRGGARGPGSGPDGPAMAEPIPAGPLGADVARPAVLPANSPVEEPGTGPGLSFAGWRMDLGMRLLHDPSGRLIALSDGEFRLLRAFAEHPRRVLTRDQLLEWSRGDTTENFDRAIDVQLSRLRRKLSASADHGADELIRTVRNEGYLFVPTVRRD